MERAILYVSRKSLTTINSEHEIEDIVAQARSRNAAAGITGALACTQHNFAQLIEGPVASVENLMHRIERDDRHTDITILRITAITRRQLPEWSLAYSGASSYVARLIEPLIGSEADILPGRIDRLASLLIGLATAEVPIR